LLYEHTPVKNIIKLRCNH